MTPEEAVAKIDVILAHAWMVRTFLKHADEIQEDEDFMEVPRSIFDYCRAVEPAAQRGELAVYLKHARAKLPRMRKAAEFFAANFTARSDHTNWRMASISLTACVRAIEEILATLPKPTAPPQA